MSIYKIAKDLTNDPEKHYFAKNNDIYFTFKLTGPNSERLLDKTYLHFKYTKTDIYTIATALMEF